MDSQNGPSKSVPLIKHKNSRSNDHVYMSIGHE